MSRIFGPIKLPNNDAFVGDIIFRPLLTPLADPPDFITTEDIRVTTDAGGNFSVTLRVGQYACYVGKSEHVCLCIPDDDNEYAFLDVICSPIMPDFVNPPGGTEGCCPMATATVHGKVRTDISEADPVVYTKTTLDAALNLVVADLTALAALTVPPLVNIRFVLANTTEGSQGIFYYKPDSVEDDDAINVIEPDAGDGRWLRFQL